MSAPAVTVRLLRGDAEAIVPVLMDLLGDPSRPLGERAAWLSLGAQLLRQLPEAGEPERRSW